MRLLAPDEVGEVRQVGGVPPQTLRYPWNMTATTDGVLYVHDRDRESLIRIDESTRRLARSSRGRGAHLPARRPAK